MPINDPVHQAVREHYAERIKKNAACCDTSANLYPAELLASVPGEIAETSYGCGDSITLASLQEGQTALDLGSGAGLDCLLASRKVGASGRVIGVDMTPEMIERARENARRVGAVNVEFRQGYLEDLPVESDSVDAVISNCVINLAPDKSRVFREIFRVLKPGGRLAVSDILAGGELPAEIKRSLSAWAGCIAGAEDSASYERMMRAAGLTDVEIRPVYFDAATLDSIARDLGETLNLKKYPPEQLQQAVFSARITARKK